MLQSSMIDNSISRSVAVCFHARQAKLNTSKIPPENSPTSKPFRRSIQAQRAPRHLKPLLPINKPIPNRNANHRAHKRARIINRGRINWQHRRERQEDQNIHDIYQREQIDRDGPAAELERTVNRVSALEFADHHEEDRDAVEVHRDGGERD